MIIVIVRIISDRYTIEGSGVVDAATQPFVTRALFSSLAKILPSTSHLLETKTRHYDNPNSHD